MTSWICPECGRVCPAMEGTCTACWGEPEPALSMAAAAGATSNGIASCSSGVVMVQEAPEAGDRIHYVPQFVAANWAPDWHTGDDRRFYAVPVDLDRPGDLVLPQLQAGFLGYLEPREADEVAAERMETETGRDPVTPPNRVTTMRPARGLPQWAILMVVVGVVLLAVASSVQKLMSSEESDGPHVVRASVVPRARQAAPVKTVAAASVVGKPAEEKKEVPAAVAKPRESEYESPHPDAKFIAVTGLKVVRVDGRPLVQYLVVNRSASPLADIGIHIAVRPADAGPEEPPQFTVAARVPNLAARQSKEIRMSLDAPISPGDDSAFRTDVRVTLER